MVAANPLDELLAGLEQSSARFNPASRGIRTTVDISGGQSKRDPEEAKKLNLIGRMARKFGLGPEGARVAQAIAKTEGGLSGASGDNGQSHGWFQFFEKGQLPQYAAAHGWSTEQARAVIQSQPEHAAEWALSGYLGNAIKEGLARGLTGPTLATFAQKVGQVSVSPERAGQNYQGMFGDSPTGNSVPDQFNSELPTDVAYAACGPAAAIAFARKFGRNPTMDEAITLAKTVGWDTSGGMNGVRNQAKLLEKMGIAHRLDESPDPSMIAHDAASGNPVIISTPQHYYFADAYDTRTGRLHVGKSGTNRKGGAEWMSVYEIKNLDGGISGALFASSESGQTDSAATRQVSGDRDDYRATSLPTKDQSVPDSPVLRSQLNTEASRLAEESLGITAQSKRDAKAIGNINQHYNDLIKQGGNKSTSGSTIEPRTGFSMDEPGMFDSQLDPTADLYRVPAREKKIRKPLLG